MRRYDNKIILISFLRLNKFNKVEALNPFNTFSLTKKNINSQSNWISFTQLEWQNIVDIEMVHNLIQAATS
jgi:hypothetical protein